MTDVLAPEIRLALEKLDERKRFLIDIQPSVEVAREFCTRNRWPAPRVEPFPKGKWPPIIVVAFEVSLKAVAPHLEWLAKHDHRQSEKARDIPELTCRGWTCGNIGLMVLMGLGQPVDTGGQRCQYVEVGTKEVPIYELQCDDGTKPPSLPSS